MFSPPYSAGSDELRALATFRIDPPPGPSAQYAIESWESEGGTPAVARDADLAPSAPAEESGWPVDNTIGWFAEHRSRESANSGIFDYGIVSAGEEEDRILQCLGAAVMLRWNSIPTKLRWELQAGTLKARIARSLHAHKNDVLPMPHRPQDRSATR